jgi:ABC-type nickel/cobalt efflux system permease component RcnA
MTASALVANAASLLMVAWAIWICWRCVRDEYSAHREHA